jgi:hypothetical protein
LFRTPEEKEQRQYDRNLARQHAEDERNRTFAEEQRISSREEQRRWEAQQLRDKREFEEQKRLDANKSHNQVLRDTIENMIGMMGEPDENGKIYGQKEQREIESIATGYAEVLMNPKYNEEMQNSYIKQAIERLEKVPRLKKERPIEREVTRGNGQVDVVDENNKVLWTKKEIQDKVEEQKAAKEEARLEKLWVRALDKAEKDLQNDESKPVDYVPSEDEIVARAQQLFNRMKALPSQPATQQQMAPQQILQSPVQNAQQEAEIRNMARSLKQLGYSPDQIKAEIARQFAKAG